MINGLQPGFVFIDDDYYYNKLICVYWTEYLQAQYLTFPNKLSALQLFYYSLLQ